MSDDPVAPDRQKDISVPLSFEDAIAAALETPPEPEGDKPFGKRARDASRTQSASQTPRPKSAT